MLASLSSNNAALAPVARFSAEQRCLSIAKFHLAYAGKMALRDLTLDLPRHRVTAFIGPSGCGKSTLLRAINRLHDLNESVTHSGHIQLEGQDIHAGHECYRVATARWDGVSNTQPFPYVDL